MLSYSISSYLISSSVIKVTLSLVLRNLILLILTLPDVVLFNLILFHFIFRHLSYLISRSLVPYLFFNFSWCCHLISFHLTSSKLPYLSYFAASAVFRQVLPRDWRMCDSVKVVKIYMATSMSLQGHNNYAVSCFRVPLSRFDRSPVTVPYPLPPAVLE